jgi:hypothetical protein
MRGFKTRPRVGPPFVTILFRSDVTYVLWVDHALITVSPSINSDECLQNQLRFLLFSLYFAPLSEQIKSFGFILHYQYADDTQLYIAIS